MPCGIADKAVTSLAAEGVDVSMAEVVDAVVARARRRSGATVGSTARTWPGGCSPRTWHPSAGARVRARPRCACSMPPGRKPGSTPPPASPSVERKPEWLRVKAHMGQEYRALQRTMRQLDLVTVCEEAGCPNIYECWADGTATFMINGDRCTRACGFCLVDTSKPLPPDPGEARTGGRGGGPPGPGPRRGHHRRPRRPGRRRRRPRSPPPSTPSAGAVPGTAVEVLISDCKGDPSALETIFAARPDVLNHNLETVPACSGRCARPASYARSLAVLARAKAAGLTTKSGLIVGMGETATRCLATLADLQGVGVDIVTIGPVPAAHVPSPAGRPLVDA